MEHHAYDNERREWTHRITSMVPAKETLFWILGTFAVLYVLFAAAAGALAR